MDEQKPAPVKPEPTQPARARSGSLKDKTRKLAELASARLAYPENKQLKNEVYEEAKELIDRDPYVAYEGENEAIYRAHNHAEEVLIIPKGRAVPEPYPAPRPEELRKAYHFLRLAALGLLLSGLGAVLLAPFAGLHAARAMSRSYHPADRARGRAIFALAVGLFLLGLALAYLLLLHLVG